MTCSLWIVPLIFLWQQSLMIQDQLQHERYAQDSVPHPRLLVETICLSSLAGFPFSSSSFYLRIILLFNSIVGEKVLEKKEHIHDQGFMANYSMPKILLKLI